MAKSPQRSSFCLIYLLLQLAGPILQSDMGDFRRNDRSSDRGGRDFPRRDFGRRDFGRRDDRGGDRQMFDAVCSNCGKDCQVPFKPTSGKPIFCSECFDKQGGHDRGPRERSFGRPERSFDRPRPSGGESRGPSDLSVKIEALSTKLDTIINLLSVKEAPAVEVAPVVKVAPKKTSKAKAKKTA